MANGKALSGGLILSAIILAVLFALQVTAATDREADIEARSGTADVTLTGVLQTDRIMVDDVATLETWAEYEETSLTVRARPGSDWQVRSPMIQVSFANLNLTCITPRNWAWNRGENELALRCNAYVRIEQFDRIGEGIVRVGI